MTDTYIKASINLYNQNIKNLKKKCMMPISVGQPKHEGEYFDSTLLLVNMTFSEAIILVCDTLQKYTMAIVKKSDDPDSLYISSLEAGDKWIERSDVYIKKLKIPYKIVRWDELLSHPKFFGYHEYVQKQYTENLEYFASVNKAVEDYISRLSERTKLEYGEEAKGLARRYVLEECAAMSVYAEENHCDFFLYPNPMGVALDAFRLFKLSTVMVGIIFKKRKINATRISSSFEYLIKEMPGHVYWKDKEGRYLGCNLNFAKSCGFSKTDSIINKFDSDFMTKEHAEILRNTDISVMQNKKEVIIEESAVLNEKMITFLSHKVPLIDRKGSVIGISGVSINMIEQKDKESKLYCENRINALTLDAVVSRVEGHVYWKSKDGVYLGCNKRQAESFGMSIAEFIGKTTFQLPMEANNIREIVKSDEYVMNTAKSKVVEECVTINNTDFIFVSHKAPLIDDNGVVVGMVGVSLDITKQKNAEDKLRAQAKKLEKQTKILSEALKTKDRVLNNLSHEIRTPIHVISSLTEGMLEQYHQMTDKERIDFVKLLNTTSSKLAKLVNNLLLVAKIKKDKSLNNVENIDLVEITKPIIKELSVISKSDLNIDAPQTLHLNCTKYQIEQVIRNLLENAIRYGNNKPIVISLKKKKDKVVIEVMDQGIGVPEDEKFSVFEVFEESQRTKRSSGGTGLGLAICKDIVEAHDGKIFVEPGDNNCGSKFVVVLPIINKDEKI